MRYRVFVSHGSSDLWVAQQIDRRIREDTEAETFIDAFDISKGDDIEDRVFAEIVRANELVVLLTPRSVDRNWVWVEIGAARASKCRIVPILYDTTLDEIEDERGGSTFLRAKNVVDINGMDDYLKDLKRRVSKHKR